MKKFLRYGSRHRIYFPRGYNGKTLPQLNPLSSSSHGANRKRTWSINEPVWAMRLRHRLFAFAGKQRCPQRDDIGVVNHQLLDSWDIMPDGNRTCSYCGSIHPEDMANLVKKCIATNAEEVSIDPSDKSYKTYVKQRGVRNAGEGAIKFYMHHVTPELMLPESQAEYKAAVKLSNAHHQKIMAEMRASWASAKK